jgi:hypothetical protein
MKFQKPGTGLRIFYQLAKLYGGHSNWYGGKRWAFRTRWRLILVEKAVHSSGQNRFNADSEPTSVKGHLGIRWFFKELFYFNLV